MDLWPPNIYEKLAVSRGLDSQAASAAYRDAAMLQQRGLPPVLTLKHLSLHTDVPYKYIRRVVARNHNPYRVFHSRKRSGGYRIICVPEPKLLIVQKWIAKYLLAPTPTHPASYAYSKGSSPLKCAQRHLG